jgi:hypothetical protein
MPMVVLERIGCSISQGMVQIRTSRSSERIRPISSAWKVGDRLRSQGKALAPAVIDADPQGVVDEVQIDLEVRAS